MSIALICISLLAFLCIALGFAVSLVRGKFDVLTSYSTDPENTLHKIIRAHGNTIEYAPILALIMYILDQSPQPSWVLWFMVLVTLCRYIIVAGLVIPKTMAKVNPMRFAGSLGTYIFGFGLCVSLIVQVLST